MTWTPILDALIRLAAVALSALGVWLGVAWRRWLDARRVDGRTRELLDRAARYVATEVAALAQTAAADLRAKAADGRLSSADAHDLAADAVRRVKITLGEAGVAALNAATGERAVDSYLRALVEAQVLAIKRPAAGLAQRPALDPAQGDVLPATIPPRAP